MKSQIHRREFLAAVGSAASGVMLGGCQAPSPATAKPPATRPGGVTIIDTHTHFYDPTRAQGVPWPPREDALLYRTVLPQNYLALPTPQAVTGTVVVEASPWVEDNQWVLNLAQRNPFIVGLVGNLPLGQSEFAGHLKRFAANPLFRGLRIRDRKLEGALAERAFMADIHLLAAHDLALDLVGGAEILPFAERLAGMAPNLRIVIDHLAGVRIDGKEPPAEWQRQMQGLARHTHVFCKVSGLVEGTGRDNGSAPREVEFYRPVLDTIWKLFGPDRLLYGSNWPVSERFAPLGVVQGIIGDYFRSHGHSAEAKVFSQNAQAVYRWVKRPG